METEFDFSVRSAPDTWFEASEEAPPSDTNPIRHKAPVQALPQHEDVDLITTLVAATGMSAIAGWALYQLEMQNATTSPWVAVVLGVLIAIAVRLGGGSGSADVRAAVSVVFYLLTLLGVTYLVEHAQYAEIYGPDVSVANVEKGLIRDRLREPMTLLAWAVGLFLAPHLSYLLRKR